VCKNEIRKKREKDIVGHNRQSLAEGMDGISKIGQNKRDMKTHSEITEGCAYIGTRIEIHRMTSHGGGWEGG